MKKQHGFSLVELLITTAITGLIFTVVGGITYQLNMVADYGNDRLTVCHDLQNLSNRFYIDCYDAVSVKTGKGLSLILPTGQIITYDLSGTDVIRSAASLKAVLARNVDSLYFNVKNNMITMNIISSTPGRIEDSEESQYQVYMRSVSQ